MEYTKIAQTSELNNGEKKKISLNNKDILLANISGTYYAVDNRCPHMGGSLADGELKGSNIICPKHGSVFDIISGKVNQRGKLFFMKVPVTDIHVYPVKIDGNDILIGIK